MRSQGAYFGILKGTEASLSYVQGFLYLVSSSINVSIFHYMAGYLLDRCCILHKAFPLIFPVSNWQSTY